MSRNRTLGDKGEQIAVNYLNENHFEVLETNWTKGHKEIDIIAKQGDIYIFVEVKTRQTKTFGHPEESISKLKIKSVTEAATYYLIDKKYKDIRFDVISIYLPKNKDMELLHIKDAFY